MQELNMIEVEQVAGGADDAATVRQNAETAERTCGKGHVGSVSTTGFTCK